VCVNVTGQSSRLPADANFETKDVNKHDIRTCVYVLYSQFNEWRAYLPVL